MGEKIPGGLKILFLGLLFLVSFQNQAQDRFNAFASGLEKLSQDPSLTNLEWSFALQDLESGKKVAYHGEKPLIPASLTKLFTAYHSLSHFGMDQRFFTVLATDGKLSEDGSLKGDLWIVGKGDPWFCSERGAGLNQLSTLLKVLPKLGIKHIDGNIIVYNGFFEHNPVPGTWSYADMGNYYAAGVFGLGYRDNMFRVRFIQNQMEGSPAKIVGLEPSPPGLVLENQVTTGPLGSGDRAFIHGSPYATRYFIEGTIPPGTDTFTIKGALPDPALMLAADLPEFLERISVSYSGKIVPEYHQRNQPFEWKLDSISGAGMGELISYMLRESDNQVAEYLYRHLSKKESSPEPGLLDGSGLSRANQVSSNRVLEILTRILQEPGTNPIVSSLAVGGESGTLKYRFGSSGKRFISAKTGSMNGVRALAGYIMVDGSPNQVFCYLINGPNQAVLEASTKFDALLSSMLD